MARGGPKRLSAVDAAVVGGYRPGSAQAAAAVAPAPMRQPDHGASCTSYRSYRPPSGKTLTTVMVRRFCSIIALSDVGCMHALVSKLAYKAVQIIHRQAERRGGDESAWSRGCRRGIPVVRGSLPSLASALARRLDSGHDVVARDETLVGRDDVVPCD